MFCLSYNPVLKYLVFYSSNQRMLSLYQVYDFSRSVLRGFRRFRLCTDSEYI